MQRKLSEIAEIPKILSSTLETVSQTFDKFLPPEEDHQRRGTYGSDEMDSISDDGEEEIVSEVDCLELEKKCNNVTPESDYVSESGDEEDDGKLDSIGYTESMKDGIEDSDEDDHFHIWNTDNTPVVNIEEADNTFINEFKKEKKEKIEKLERAWPWADRQVTWQKRSTCYLVPKKPLGIVEDRIKLLAKKNITGLYERRMSET